MGKHQSEKVVGVLVSAFSQACATADNDGNLPLHVAIEYEGSDEIIHMLLKQNVGASRVFNALHKLPYDLAKEHNASVYIVDELERADKEAREKEVGILAWLWG